MEFGRVDGDGMLVVELEVAEALAGLARSSAVLRESETRSIHQIDAADQGKAVGPQQFCGNTSTTVPCPVYTKSHFDKSAVQTSTSCLSKPGKTSRPILTEAEKEERRLNRILANRESARRTIRRRQSMYTELMAKAGSLSQLNMYLKKEKEQAVKKYNCLKDKNEFLKAKVAEVRMTRFTEMQKTSSSRPEKSPATMATTPVFLYKQQPPLFPLFWPSILPPGDIVKLQCGSYPGIAGVSQIQIPDCEKPCSYQGKESSTEVVTEQGTPMFLLPVPWLLPFLTQNGTSESVIQDKHKESSFMYQHCSCTSSSTKMQENSHRWSVTPNSRQTDAPKSIISCYNRTGFSFPPDGGGQNLGIRRKASVHEGSSVFSPSDCRTYDFTGKRTGEQFVEATEARKKRKELMKFKNFHFPDVHVEQ